VIDSARGADGAYLIDAETATFQLPASADVCYVTLVDPDGSQTQDPNDQLSESCSDAAYNVEFVIVRRRGVPAPSGTHMAAECERSACPDEHCPGIGQ
jgi:hypothetical protein